MPRQLKGPSVDKFPQEKQARMDELLDRNSSERITVAEKAELESLVQEAERLMSANAKRLVQYCRRHAGPPKRRGTPVTVWVTDAGAKG